MKAYPLSKKTNGPLALPRPAALIAASPTSATFCVSANVIDRDGDFVEVEGIDTRTWERSGSPVFFGHQENPFPVGTAIDPRTKKLAWWVKDGKAYSTVFWDQDDPDALFVAKKVAKGIIKGASIAFVVKEVEPMDRLGRKRNVEDHERPGWHYKKVELSEWSIAPVQSNPLAVLEGATKSFAARFGGCIGRWCAPQHKGVSPAVVQEWRRLRRHAVRLGLIKNAVQADVEGSTLAPRDVSYDGAEDEIQSRYDEPGASPDLLEIIAEARRHPRGDSDQAIQELLERYKLVSTEGSDRRQDSTNGNSAGSRTPRQRRETFGQAGH